VSPPKTGSYHPHPPSPLLLLSWYSFYRPMEGGRLSRPRHCTKGAQPITKAVYLSCCRDKHNCLWHDSNLGPLTPQSDVPTTRPLRPDDDGLMMICCSSSTSRDSRQVLQRVWPSAVCPERRCTALQWGGQVQGETPRSSWPWFPIHLRLPR